MKNIFKKILSTTLTLGLLGVMLAPSQAMAVVKVDTIDLSKPSENVIVSEPMTFEEMACIYAENKGVSIEEARRDLGGYSDSHEKNGLQGISPQALTFRTIKQFVSVTTEYKPTIEYYCQTSESGSYWGIIEIRSTDLNRRSTVPGFETVTKLFEGYIKSELESAYQIYYIINGDFYNNASDMEVSGNVTIGIKQIGELSFDLTVPLGHYSYCYKSGRITLQS